jgi:uncharacterized phage-associated protein
MAQIEFQLDADKVVASAIYIAQRGVPDLTVGKMMKMLFLADKYHLVRYGRPITGDRYEAMNDGPVPSFAYDLFKQMLHKPLTEQCKRLASALDIDRSYELPRFRLNGASEFDKSQLSISDIKSLDRTVNQFGARAFEELSAITHAMAAYDKAWKSRGFFSRRAHMKFEDFFEDDAAAIAGAKDEMVENFYLRKSFAKA